CLPLGATAPVSAILNPTLIGSAATANPPTQGRPAARIASKAHASTRLTGTNIVDLLPLPFDRTRPSRGLVFWMSPSLARRSARDTLPLRQDTSDRPGYRRPDCPSC